MTAATGVLQVGDQIFQATDLLRLLAVHQLLLPLLRGIVTDKALADIPCIPEETRQWVQAFWQQQQATTPEQQQAWLQKHHLTPEQVEMIASRPHRLQRFKEKTWGADVSSYFLQRKDQLDRVIYSLIRVPDPGVAQEVYFRISDGEQSFTEAAQQFSQGPEAMTGGLIGPMPLGRLHPSLRKLLAMSQPGQLWPPVQLGQWWVIVRLERLLPAQLDDTTRQQLLDELFEQWLEQQLSRLSWKELG
ncbi:MAG: peptidylprolyl isomerase [Gloeomargarita sp. SKYBB_i_bin120]|nr:peptidylprolyl isomerase [Gloeomargarita sp. SKYB120]MDW8177975.1 peptidylprolyl isomerase [Gloeomargarita sp. SKYBB_i_bin120]